jgi:hypothetical protein
MKLNRLTISGYNQSGRRIEGKMNSLKMQYVADSMQKNEDVASSLRIFNQNKRKCRI